MTMDARKQRVLQAIVALYGLEGEPVGSSVLANYFDMAVSSATLRNEMAALTKLGLLEQPHTSAGRVPSAKGYRYYLDNLLTDDQPLEKVMESRKPYLSDGDPEHVLLPCEGSLRPLLCAWPIIAAGDVTGAVGLLAEDRTQQPDPAQQKAVAVAAAFLAKQMEEGTLLSQFSKIVPIKIAYLRYAVCGCCLCIKNANCYIIRGASAFLAGAPFFVYDRIMNLYKLFREAIDREKFLAIMVLALRKMEC